MVRWYELGLDWLIAHTTIEMAFCLFVVGVCGLVAFGIWVVTFSAKTLNSDIEIWEAIKSARTPYTHCRASAFTKVTDSE